MNPHTLLILGVFGTTLASLYFSAITYALRDFSRSRLSELLAGRKTEKLVDVAMGHVNDLIFITATLRLLANLLALLGIMAIIQPTQMEMWMQYLLSLLIAGVIALVASVALPHALAKYATERLIAASLRLLLGLRWLFAPVTRISHWIDSLVKRAAGQQDTPHEEIEQEILSAVEEGEKEGVVDEKEREMIESVITFADTSVGQIMTARPEISGLDISSNLPQVQSAIERTGHSRLPVYEGTLDQIIGILYARDVIHFIGQPATKFDLRQVMRAPFYVPETKKLPDLLEDFRLQKVHIAIVLDEYGGTAGLITIEDLMEELVGEISDEHEPLEPAMFKRLNDNSCEVDARMYIDELNRLIGANIPEDAGYNTLGGFVSTTLGRIGEVGASFQFENARYTVLDSEPQKVNRLRIDMLDAANESGQTTTDATAQAAAQTAPPED